MIRGKSKYKNDWDLSLIIRDPSDREIIKMRKLVLHESDKFINKWKDRTDYLESPEVLKEAINDYNYWYTNWSNNSTELYYYNLLSSIDQDNADVKAKLQKAQELGVQIQNKIQFFEYNISKINKNTQKLFLVTKELQDYKHFLERWFKTSSHILSDSEEKIMNLKSTPAHTNWIQMVERFLSKEERVVNTINGDMKQNLSSILGLIDNQNKKIRDSAVLAVNDIFLKNLDVAENEINAILLNKKTNDEIRNYQRADQERHLSDDIDTSVVDTLVNVITSNFDISKKYYRLKAKLMGVKKLKYNERNIEYGNNEKQYTYDEGVRIISNVFENLDKEFADIFLKFVISGLIDVYPKKGKRGGAFCSYDLITHPVYILLNWTDKLNDVRTLAHEMGHAINDELIRKKQKALNYGTPTSTAEVASTFMEDFVTQKLIKDADDNLKLSLMMSKLNQDVSSIFRQVAFYNFETELHKRFREKGYLSGNEIGKLFSKHMVSYMGPAVEQSPGSENWWVYVSHFRNFFYVYSYASGSLISKSLQSEVKKNPKFIIRVKEFLSTGLSDSPKNIFKKLNINIADVKFWKNGLNEVENLLNETTMLAKKLKKIK